jgi:hypothetical protein
MPEHARNRSHRGPSSGAASAVSTKDSPNRRDDQVPIDERIRVRAYELYLERSGQPGDDVGDWLRAEHSLRGEPSSERGAG